MGSNIQYSHRTYHRDISGSTILAAADDLSATPRVLVTGKTGHTIHIQRIVVNVLTDNAATQSFRGTTGSAPVIARTKASPGLGPIIFEFGDEGRALDESESFELSSSAAGLAADIHWEGYMRHSGVQTAAAFASA